jgi:myo-inositol-1(or 4)-monophosphatase
VEPEAFALHLARRIRSAASPMLGDPAARRRAGTAHGGDPTYAIDERAERVVRDAFADAVDVAYFTEDEGLVRRGSPDTLYLIDPIDGTRPAAAGYESCCVTIAVAPFGTEVTIDDVTYGCIVELGSGATFEARRGGGVAVDGARVAPTSARELRGLFWSGGFRGQPAVPLAAVLADLFDAPGSEGAFFDHGSAAYSLSRLATGQLDAFVDPGPALIESIPELEEAFRRVGGGHTLNTTTYDATAGYLLLSELGRPVTDALGRSLGGVLLIDPEGRASEVSTAAAVTPELHDAILGAIRRGLERARALLDAVGIDALLG